MRPVISVVVGNFVKVSAQIVNTQVGSNSGTPPATRARLCRWLRLAENGFTRPMPDSNLPARIGCAYPDGRGDL